MEQIVVRRVTDPSLDRYRIVWRDVRILGEKQEREKCVAGACKGLTLMEHVAQRAIVQNDNLAQIRLHRAQVLDERALSERAVLPVVACGKELPFRLEPVDDGVGVLLDRRREDHQVVPLAYLHCLAY